MSVDHRQLQGLLKQIESELLGSERQGFFSKLFGASPKPARLPIRGLRLKEQQPFGKVIAWSYVATVGKDLDTRAAEDLLNSRLASLDLRLGPATHSTDDDGSTLVFWDIRPAESTTRFKKDVERWDRLDSDDIKREATRLVNGKQFPLLLTLLRESKYPGCITDSLRECDDPGVAQEIISLLKNPSPYIRGLAAMSLGPLGGQEAARALCDALPNATGDELMWIAEALGRLSWPGALQPLTEAFHRNMQGRDAIYLASALARCGGQEGLDFLIAGLNKTDDLQDEYTAALAEVNDTRAIPAMKAHLQRLQSRGVHETYQETPKEFLKRHGAL